MLRLPLVLALVLATQSGDDPYCPAYPKPQRTILEARQALQRSVFPMTAQTVHPVVMWSAPRGAAAVVPNNFIDQHIFGAMVADNVNPAPDAGTTEILRRLSLDLTGRIPTIEKIEEFVASDDPTKRDKLIDELIASEAFVDNWTAYFANHFEVTSNYYNFVGIPGRNLFYDYIRDFVARDRFLCRRRDRADRLQRRLPRTWSSELPGPWDSAGRPDSGHVGCTGRPHHHEVPRRQDRMRVLSLRCKSSGTDQPLPGRAPQGGVLGTGGVPVPAESCGVARGRIRGTVPLHRQRSKPGRLQRFRRSGEPGAAAVSNWSCPDTLLHVHG